MSLPRGRQSMSDLFLFKSGLLLRNKLLFLTLFKKDTIYQEAGFLQTSDIAPRIPSIYPTLSPFIIQGERDKRQLHIKYS